MCAGRVGEYRRGAEGTKGSVTEEYVPKHASAGSSEGRICAYRIFGRNCSFSKAILPLFLSHNFLKSIQSNAHGFLSGSGLLKKRLFRRRTTVYTEKDARVVKSLAKVMGFLAHGGTSHYESALFRTCGVLRQKS